MEKYDEFEINGQIFNVTYKNEKDIVWAITYVNSSQIKAHGDCIQTAYWAIRNHDNIVSKDGKKEDNNYAYEYMDTPWNFLDYIDMKVCTFVLQVNFKSTLCFLKTLSSLQGSNQTKTFFAKDSGFVSYTKLKVVSKLRKDF